MVTGHGKLKSCYYRLHVIEDAHATFTDALYKLDQQRNVLRTSITKRWNLATTKHEFISKHLKEFCKFVNSIDFEIFDNNNSSINLIFLSIANHHL
jgi:hypothetical protein